MFQCIYLHIECCILLILIGLYTGTDIVWILFFSKHWWINAGKNQNLHILYHIDLYYRRACSICARLSTIGGGRGVGRGYLSPRTTYSIEWYPVITIKHDGFKSDFASSSCTMEQTLILVNLSMPVLELCHMKHRFN